MAVNDTIERFVAANTFDQSTGGSYLDQGGSTYFVAMPDSTSSIPAVTFTSLMPRNYNGNSITVSMFFQMATDTTATNNVTFLVDMARLFGTTFLVPSFATAVVGLSAIPGSIIPFRVDAVLPPVNVPAAIGEPYTLRIQRNNFVPPNAVGDARLYGVELHETA